MAEQDPDIWLGWSNTTHFNRWDWLLKSVRFQELSWRPMRVLASFRGGACTSLRELIGPRQLNIINGSHCHLVKGFKCIWHRSFRIWHFARFVKYFCGSIYKHEAWTVSFTSIKFWICDFWLSWLIKRVLETWELVFYLFNFCLFWDY